MSSSAGSTTISTKMLWTGRVLSALVVLFMLFDGIIKLVKIQPVMLAMSELDYPDELTISIGVVGLLCTLLYAVPRTSILGAILLTAYFGGATAAKIRVEEFSFLFSVGMGVLAWGGLFFRDEHLRALIPFERSLRR